jgi:DnaJ family protein C protein 2
LKIQKAYETLTDPAKKKIYDSSLPFDESVPKMSDCKDDTEFYDKFGKVFVRNAKFSNIKPTPNLGFANTPIAEVKSFYKFWDGFKTWRTFNQYDEFDENDLDHAEDRFEKRWMDKQNEKCRK